MPTILPQFDLGGSIGQSLGGGLGDALKLLSKRQVGLEALKGLENIDTDSFDAMSLPQQLATLKKTGIGLGEVGSEIGDILPTYFKERGRRAGGEVSRQIAEGDQAILDTAQQMRGAAEKSPLDAGQEVVTQGAPKLAGIPNNAPGSVRQFMKVFPDFEGSALRGNPQGLSIQDKAKFVNDVIRAGGTQESALRQANEVSDYFQQQHQFYQGLTDAASQEAKQIYGGTPFENLMERSMLREVDRQMDKGNLEPNSVLSVAKQKAKNIEATINKAPGLLGRPWQEFGIDDRKQKAGSWISPLLKDGEIQGAIEMLVSRDLGVDKDGKRITGPDYGPVRATEIVQERINPKGIKSINAFGETLEDSNYGKYSKAPNPQEKHDEAVRRNVAKLAEYMADPKKFTDKDSLVLLRAKAWELGVPEDAFSEAVNMAKRKRNGEFSAYQNWEESNFLPNNVKPSIWEMLNGIRAIGDRISGKK